jgi:hypothetical protein
MEHRPAVVQGVQPSQSTAQPHFGALWAVQSVVFAPTHLTFAARVSPAKDSRWERDGVTLKVRFCEGGATYRITEHAAEIDVKNKQQISPLSNNLMD